MKTMDDYVQVRQMHEIKGLSLREISRRTGSPDGEDGDRDTAKCCFLKQNEAILKAKCRLTLLKRPFVFGPKM